TNNEFVTVPSNAVAPASAPTVLPSCSDTPQQINRGTPTTPTNSSRTPSAAGLVMIPTTGRSSTPASAGDDQLTQNNADASRNLDDSPRKRLQKQESENSQFLQDLVKMMEASSDGADPSASADAAYPTIPTPADSPDLQDQVKMTDVCPDGTGPQAFTNHVHCDLASTSHGVHNTDSPARKKSRLHGATDNDAAMEQSASTDERNAISVLFGLARKRDNKHSVRFLLPKIQVLDLLQSVSDLPSLIPEQQQRSATSLDLVPTQSASTSSRVCPSFPHTGTAADITAALQQLSALRQTQTPSPAVDSASLQQLLTLSSMLQQLKGQAVQDIQTVQEPSGSNGPTTATQNLAFESLPPISNGTRRNTIDASQLSVLSQQATLVNTMLQGALSLNPTQMSNSELHAALAQFDTPAGLQSLANQRQHTFE
ncbi:hypothetical protein AAVH_35367, partial [Aphelenchoides avenae]